MKERKIRDEMAVQQFYDYISNNLSDPKRENERLEARRQLPTSAVALAYDIPTRGCYTTVFRRRAVVRLHNDVEQLGINCPR